MDWEDCMMMNMAEKIIPVVRTDREFRQSLITPGRFVFHMSASLLKMAPMAKIAKEHGKELYIHIDFAEGLGRDMTGIQYLSKIGAAGIISTRSNLLRMAGDCGLKKVQRVFIMDSRSVETALESIRSVEPTMVEIMPGLIPKVIGRFRAELHIPVVAAGLIENKEEAAAALEAGAAYVSTTKTNLWNV